MVRSRQENTHRALGAVLFGGAVIFIGAEATRVADANLSRDFLQAWLMTSYILLAIGIWSAVALKRDMLVIAGTIAASLGALGLAYSSGAMIPNDLDGIRLIESSTIYMIEQILAVAGVAAIGVALLLGQRRGTLMMPLGALLIAAAAFAAATHIFNVASPWRPVSLIVLGVALLAFAVAASSPDRWLVREAVVSPS